VLKAHQRLDIFLASYHWKMNTCEKVTPLSKITYFSSIGKCLLTIACLQGPYNLSHFVHTMCTCENVIYLSKIRYFSSIGIVY